MALADHGLGKAIGPGVQVAQETSRLPKGLVRPFDFEPAYPQKRSAPPKPLNDDSPGKSGVTTGEAAGRWPSSIRQELQTFGPYRLPPALAEQYGKGLPPLDQQPDGYPSGEIWAPKEATEVWIGTAVPTSYKIINPFSSETQGRIEVSPNATQALIKGAQRPLENGGGANLTPLERQMLEVDRFNNAVSEALRLGAEPGQYYSGGGYTFKIGPPAEPGGMPRIEEAFPTGDSRYDKPRLLSEAEALEIARTRPAAPQSGLDEKNKQSTFLLDPTGADPKDPAATPQAIPLRPLQTEEDPYYVTTYDAEFQRTGDSNLALNTARDAYRHGGAGRASAAGGPKIETAGDDDPATKLYGDQGGPKDPLAVSPPADMNQDGATAVKSADEGSLKKFTASDGAVLGSEAASRAYEKNLVRIKTTQATGDTGYLGYTFENQRLIERGADVMRAGETIRIPDPQSPSGFSRTEIDYETQDEVVQVKLSKLDFDQTRKTIIYAESIGKKVIIEYNEDKVTTASLKRFSMKFPNVIQRPIKFERP